MIEYRCVDLEIITTQPFIKPYPQRYRGGTMSKEAYFKIREAEAEAERMIAEAEAEAERMIAEARAAGEALCKSAEEETSAELSRMMGQIRQRGEEHIERMLSDGQEETAEIEDQICLTRRSAEKIVIRGLEAKCR